jgi:hypothetical protein
MSNQMFRRQMVSIPLHPGQFLTPHRGAEVITRAYQMTKVGFEWVTVDKPVGTILLTRRNIITIRQSTWSS